MKIFKKFIRYIRKSKLDLIDKKYSEEELEKHADSFNELDWYYISKYQSLSESFIKKYSYKFLWGDISAYQILSEKFIEKYSDKVNWTYISRYQELSETFVEKYLDKVNWIHISYSQKLSEPFIKKYFNKIDVGCLMDNKYISKEVKNEMKTLKEII
jgi:hypothetical protein